MIIVSHEIQYTKFHESNHRIHMNKQNCIRNIHDHQHKMFFFFLIQSTQMRLKKKNFFSISSFF